MCTSALVRRVCTFSYFVTLTSKHPPPPTPLLSQQFSWGGCALCCVELCCTTSCCPSQHVPRDPASLPADAALPMMTTPWHNSCSQGAHTQTPSPHNFFSSYFTADFTHTQTRNCLGASLERSNPPPPPPTILQNLSHSHTVSVILAAGFAEWCHQESLNCTQLP